MNQLIAMTNEMTMSTKEISDLTGKRHDNVMADARKMLGEIGSPEISGGYLDKQDRTQPCLLLSKDETMCLVAGYSTELRFRIVKRWRELEEVQKPVELSRLEILQMALESERARVEAEAQLAIAAPKVDAYDRVIERGSLMNASQVAQQVGMSAIKMNKKLDELGGVYSKNIKRCRAFCHSWVEDGFGEMKVSGDGYTQALFTTKGSMKVVEIFTSEGVI